MGLSGAGAHVGQLCDACLPTDLLGNWVRGREVTLERAVHKLTGEPAGVYGFEGRSVLAVGDRADITVFDPDTVAPGPVRRIRDFPADGERLVADQPGGMRHVLVNGTPIESTARPTPTVLPPSRATSCAAERTTISRENQPVTQTQPAKTGATGNWGRWGDDDERGTLNLIHPEAVLYRGVEGGQDRQGLQPRPADCRATARRCSRTAAHRSGSRSRARPTPR